MDVGLFLPTMAPRGATPDALAARRPDTQSSSASSRSGWLTSSCREGAYRLSTPVALAVAAGATNTIRLGYGLMIVPLRPVVWAAKYKRRRCSSCQANGCCSVWASVAIAMTARGTPRACRGTSRVRVSTPLSRCYRA